MKRRSFLQMTLAAVAFAASSVSVAVRSAVADLGSKVNLRRRALLPPVPKWNPLTDDIDSADFQRRCCDFQRSLLPRDLAFPRTGQIWEAVQECELPVPTWKVGPKGLELGPNVRLAKGERVRILELDDPRPLQIRFQPIRKDALPANLPAVALDHGLWLPTASPFAISNKMPACFTDLFRLVEDVV
jgi:hypothetical protein